MIEIRLVDTDNKRQVNEFVQFHFDLYKGTPAWVPPFRGDVEIMLNKHKHAFYEHSQADFFTAWQDGKMVGRVAVLDNTKYNAYHHENNACLFLYDSIDSQEVANALFDKCAEWARARGLDGLLGPKGFSLFDGYGLLVEGFIERQCMNMSAYNFPYYQTLWENYGFERVNDYVSMKLDIKKFQMPEKAKRVCEIVEKRGTLVVKRYKTRKEVLADSDKIAHMYFDSFKNNWEYYPMTDNEFRFFVENVLKFVDPSMIGIIADPAKDGKIVGMLAGFPDLSAAMQRHNGKMTPALILDILFETHKTDTCVLNGLGILEEYHMKGGNAVLYNELERIFRGHENFKTCEAVQMADTALEVRSDMKTLGLEITKRHRVYHKSI